MTVYTMVGGACPAQTRPFRPAMTSYRHSHSSPETCHVPSNGCDKVSKGW